MAAIGRPPEAGKQGAGSHCLSPCLSADFPLSADLEERFPFPPDDLFALFRDLLLEEAADLVEEADCVVELRLCALLADCPAESEEAVLAALEGGAPPLPRKGCAAGRLAPTVNSDPEPADRFTKDSSWSRAPRWAATEEMAENQRPPKRLPGTTGRSCVARCAGESEDLSPGLP